MLEKGKDKIQEICTILKEETLEPAKQEAEKIIKQAEMQAKQIVGEANSRAKEILEKAHQDIEKEKSVFQSSLSRACKLSIEDLKQQIESGLFSSELPSLLDREIATPEIVAKLIESIVLAIEKEGLSTDFTAFIPKSLKQETINALIAKVLNKLKEKSVAVGDFDGGAKIQLNDRQITIDISEEALKNLVASFMRENFRKTFFKAMIKE